jgi:hypothetical protein
MFPDDRPLRMQLCEWLPQNTSEELFLHNILWTDEACFAHESVFNVHSSHLQARWPLAWYRRGQCRRFYL